MYAIAEAEVTVAIKLMREALLKDAKKTASTRDGPGQGRHLAHDISIY
jgi:hypothetical protein